jgi:hypothetical protein
MLIISDNTLVQLHKLRNTPKFHQDDATFYPGPPSEDVRLEAQDILDSFINTIINNIKANPRKSYFINELKIMLMKCNYFDSEEKDRICNYIEQIMNILGIENSEGIINEWRYGFNPTK